MIGVTEAKGGSAFNNPDNNVYIPISTAQVRLPRGGSPNRVQNILVSVAKAEDADLAIEEIRDVLRQPIEFLLAVLMILRFSTSKIF